MADSGPSADDVAERLLSKAVISEMKVRDPRRYEHYNVLKKKDLANSFIMMAVISPFFFIFFHWFMTPPFGDRNYSFQFLFSTAFSFVLSKATFDYYGDARRFVNAYAETRTKQKLRSEKMSSSAYRKMSEIEARGLGDTIIAHAGATVVNRSIVTSSFNAMKESEPELADALKILAGYVENSGSEEAAEALSNLTESISGNPRKPSQVKAFWNELVRVLPGVTALATAATAVTKLFT